jgi:hypothetical protein
MKFTTQHPPIELDTLQRALTIVTRCAQANAGAARPASREAVLMAIPDRRTALSAWRRAWATIDYIASNPDTLPSLAEFNANRATPSKVSDDSAEQLGAVFLAASRCKLTITGKLGHHFQRTLAEIRPALREFLAKKK